MDYNYNDGLVKLAFSWYHRTDYFTLEEAIEFLWNRDIINVGGLTEHALTRQNKSLKKAIKNAKGFDFNDKSDSKYVTVSHYVSPTGRKSSYACIGGIQNKIGTLRVMVFEPKTKLNYFFKIPYTVYEPYTYGNDSLKIYFDDNGYPRDPERSNSRYNLWDHKCTAKQWSK
jgi:hypothetical protein